MLVAPGIDPVHQHRQRFELGRAQAAANDGVVISARIALEAGPVAQRRHGEAVFRTVAGPLAIQAMPQRVPDLVLLLNVQLFHAVPVRNDAVVARVQHCSQGRSHLHGIIFQQQRQQTAIGPGGGLDGTLFGLLVIRGMRRISVLRQRQQGFQAIPGYRPVFIAEQALAPCVSG